MRPTIAVEMRAAIESECMQTPEELFMMYVVSLFQIVISVRTSLRTGDKSKNDVYRF